MPTYYYPHQKQEYRDLRPFSIYTSISYIDYLETCMCTLCYKHILTKYGAKMHVYRVHGIGKHPL